MVNNKQNYASPGKLGNPTLFILLVVIASANYLFDLTTWAHIQGKFNVRDIGLVLIGITFFSLFLRKNTRIIWHQATSIFVFTFLIIVLLQVSIVAIIYRQSLIDGFIGVRHEFYYLSFFVFLGLIDTKEKIIQFFDFIFIIGTVLSILGLINYSGIIIFHHKWAEGHGIRAGIVRAYFPGMDIITLSLFWSLAKFIFIKKMRPITGITTLMFFLVHFLRQTRGRLVGVAVALIAFLVYNKQFKVLVTLILAFSLTAGILSLTMKKNLLLSTFSSTVDDLTKKEGTWVPRMDQIRLDIQLFLKHPFIGSGTSALRVKGNEVTRKQAMKLKALRSQEDLGYTHWLKSYGVVGFVWLIFLYIHIARNIWRITRRKYLPLEPIIFTVVGYLIFVVISFVTLPHLMRPDQIILFCLVLALLERLQEMCRHEAGVS